RSTARPARPLPRSRTIAAPIATWPDQRAQHQPTRKVIKNMQAMPNNKQLGLKRRLKEASPQERADILKDVEYDVGFGKPPKASRFRAGQSGNPLGRPKRSEN